MNFAVMRTHTRPRHVKALDPTKGTRVTLDFQLAAFLSGIIPLAAAWPWPT